MTVMKETVQRYVLHSFSYLLGADNKIRYLVNKHHSLNLREMVAEYEYCKIDEPSTITDSALDEISSSVLDHFKYYDEYEKCNLAL